MATFNTKLTVTSVDANSNKKTTNIGYVNPDVDDGVLKELVNKLFSLSTNTVTEIAKVTTENITKAEYYEYKITPSSASYTLKNGEAHQVFAFTTNIPSDTENLNWQRDVSQMVGMGSVSYDKDAQSGTMEVYAYNNNVYTSTIKFYATINGVQASYPAYIDANVNPTE